MQDEQFSFEANGNQDRQGGYAELGSANGDEIAGLSKIEVRLEEMDFTEDEVIGPRDKKENPPPMARSASVPPALM